VALWENIDDNRSNIPMIKQNNPLLKLSLDKKENNMLNFAAKYACKFNHDKKAGNGN